jgi:hypothetical protein
MKMSLVVAGFVLGLFAEGCVIRPRRAVVVRPAPVVVARPVVVAQPAPAYQ